MITASSLPCMSRSDTFIHGGNADVPKCIADNAAILKHEAIDRIAGGQQTCGLDPGRAGIVEKDFCSGSGDSRHREITVDARLAAFDPDMGDQHLAGFGVEYADGGEWFVSLYDPFLEGISGNYLAKPAKCLSPLGRAVYYGDVEFTSDTFVGLSQLRSGSWTISGYSLGGLCAVAPQLWRPSAEAVLTPILEDSVSFGQLTRFAPADAAKAHEALESRASYGKMCLDWSLL